MWFWKKTQPTVGVARKSPEEYERMAEAFLRGRGYKITERNFRLRTGEIDLVAQYGNEVVFVEVRMRSNDAHGAPEETVDARKQERIRKVAATYLNARNMLQNFVARFDVIAITHKAGQEPQIHHLPNAF